MALQALQSSGVTFRRILSHFPEELSLAFAYGSGVYRQAGPNSDQKVSPIPQPGPSPDSPRQPLSAPQRGMPVLKSPILPSIPSELESLIKLQLPEHAGSHIHRVLSSNTTPYPSFPVPPPVLPASLFSPHILQDSALLSLGECLPPNAMLDFVFTVDDPFAWHSKNLKKNWNHYSFLKVLGPKMITSIQNNYGAGVYYNSLITPLWQSPKSSLAFHSEQQITVLLRQVHSSPFVGEPHQHSSRLF
ncbi:hypothetical protein P7K49_030727 [Saguinus oedipus]|uniref:Phosphatidate cytidylyltransferase, mitochondrial n=1 Tax=Saguinus oedipus TaxID=9490 RepID=A0ABQ9U305_SAGOE|nr:hypothetical protein P7K49_030727 [Saguinus oedipus]